MQLIASEAVSEEKLRFLVRAVKAVKLYYVTSGRNAWWSTWITRYEPGCMHTSMDTACAYAERRRVQGTVFYIFELPSIAILGAQGALVVSEINTDRFFSRFSTKRFSKLGDLVPLSTMTLRQFTHIFASKSDLWVAGYPLRNSSILSFLGDSEKLLEIDIPYKLKSWVSNSVGRNYSLYWSEWPFKRSRKALHSLVSLINRGLE